MLNDEGVPATVLHASSDNRAESVVVAETVQAFITAMDALRLQQRAVDEVQVTSTITAARIIDVSSVYPFLAPHRRYNELAGQGNQPARRLRRVAEAAPVVEEAERPASSGRN